MTTAIETTTGKVWVVRMGGACGKVLLVEDKAWSEDSATYRYTVETGEHWDTSMWGETDDESEVRGMVADAIRSMRTAYMETADEESKDELAEVIDLVTSNQGGAARVLALLKANGF